MRKLIRGEARERMICVTILKDPAVELEPYSPHSILMGMAGVAIET